ncbi:hypothetical protein GS896_25660 [Rhodococcus hoagii]|nr:hypothetical protein [Prescottella equi]MBM4654107.1 hypothetical protein [Prescottella equi]MBM4719581.1 hypothetical protein [Prescottella equi]NKR23380.1 hypothetical protein [Prescottella equi]NKT56009.1 hypothetical protein [Prescottella equi]
MNTRNFIIAAAVVVGLGASLTACSSDDTTDTATAAAASTTTTRTFVPPPAAPYTLHRDGKDEFTATVTTADTQALRVTWQKIRKEILASEPDGGYFIHFDCANPTPEHSPRIGNGKVAVGRLGAAQTGLNAGSHEMKFVDGARCGDDPGYTSTADRKAPLTEQSVNDLCREWIEEKYTVEQLPVTIANAKAVEGTEGKWTGTGTAQGASKYGDETAVLSYTCTAQNNTGTMLRTVKLDNQ